MKTTFLKNFFFLISTIISYSFLTAIIVIVTIIVHASGEYVRPMLITFAGITILYVAITFAYCIPKVKIEPDGIKIIHFGKVHRSISWEEIREIKKTTEHNNPAYTLYNENGEELISLDRRKPISILLKYYINKIHASAN